MQRTQTRLRAALLLLFFALAAALLVSCGTGGQTPTAEQTAPTQSAAMSETTVPTPSPSPAPTAQSVVSYTEGEPRLNYALDKSTGGYAVVGLGDCNDAEIVIPRKHAGKLVTTIGEEAFAGCRAERIVIPGSVRTIGARAFSACPNLVEMTIPETVEKIGADIFFGCRSLATVTYESSFQPGESNRFLDVPCIETVVLGRRALNAKILRNIGIEGRTVVLPDGCTSIGTAFAGTGVKSIALGAGITEVTGAFEGCTLLERVTFARKDVKIGARAFYGCASLRQIDLPSDITVIGARAFENSGLTSIVLPGSVRSIGIASFSGCASLTEVTWSETLRQIEDEAFKGCFSLSGALELPTGVSVIGKSAFEGCSSLTNLCLPVTVIEIPERAFASCTSLESLSLQYATRTVQKSAFECCAALRRVDFGDSEWFWNNCVLIDPEGNEALLSCEMVFAIELE